MGGLSIWHWLIVLVVALLLLGGRGRVSSMMGDLGKGIKSFKQSMAEEDKPAEKPAPAADARMSELNAPLPEQQVKTTTTHQG
ncbi:MULTISPECIES: twin-arginine translocase TatA/TatE family subunit [Acidocella]|uniref:twin-arginine translocase TatA/TatE family subunit n=1 Tax=Acidocella TaxID=50709 RepID=UPI00028CC497|nr:MULTISPECIES: twin-arginine translocase TatA/TatE family subunit [Acidocella]EKN00622.1 twin arginine translocase protein A [Acidocella sp. MX-AZ02]WBO60151.1 twin-arginine translocase TatA/TatE family subunit [Acidocella sp. MX-AZ03]